MHTDVVTLYRPVNDKELFLIEKLDFNAFPPRLPEQPFFYPVMNEAYATQISKQWNVPQYGVGYVTKFDVKKTFIDQYEVQNVGGTIHDELWIPADELTAFNENIVGKIAVVAEYR